MTVAERYRANYDAIAAAHLAHWRETGSNPWMADDEVALLEARTREAVRRHVEPGAAVLDAGCGMGGTLAGMPEYGRYGLDLSAEYLEVAASRGLSVQRGDVEAMPYPDAHFDAVLALDLLEHVLDLNAAVRECLRVLRPGGVLVARSPDSQDLSPFLGDTGYEFIHLRRFDEPSLRLLFGRVFGREVLEVERVTWVGADGGAWPELIAAVRA